MLKRRASSVVLAFCLLAAGLAVLPEEAAAVSLWPGSTVEFGFYEQDGVTYNGQEPIRWTVLEVRGDEALLVSEKLLDCEVYHTANRTVAWRDTHIRAWLNYTFYFSAFDGREQACIVPTRIYGSDDWVFMPDETQVNMYGLAPTGCEATLFAKRRGVQIGNDNGLGCWWVRVSVTTGDGRPKFAGIHGRVYDGNKATVANNGIRPMITVSVSELARGGFRTYSDRQQQSIVVGYTNQKIATRGGPSTEYDEIHTYDLPVGTPVIINRYQISYGVPWVEIDFQYNGGWVRVWTGKKRVDAEGAMYLPGDYSRMYDGVILWETTGSYGPGSQYLTLYYHIYAGTPVQVMGRENGWVLVQYYTDDGNTLIHRAWVREEAVSP